MVNVLHIIKKRRLVRMLAAAVAAASVISAALPLRPLGESDRRNELAVPEKVYFGNADAAKTEKPLSDYYEVNASDGGNTYKRLAAGTVTGSAKWKRGTAILYGGSYTDFSLEFDFRFSQSVSGAQQVWVLFGTEDKTKFNSENAAAVAIGADKAAKNTGCNISYVGKSSGSMLKVGETVKYDGTATHHAKIELFDGSITVTVDGSISAGKAIDVDYKGGFIGVGTGQSGVELSDIKISDSAGENGACFGKPHGDKLAAEAEEYYDIIENDGTVSYLRNAFKANNNWINDTPFINLGSYKSFTLEFDYRYSGSGERYIWLSFGNTQRYVFNEENGSAYIGLGIKKAESESTRVNGFFSDASTGGCWFDGANAGWQDSNGSGTDIDGGALHHAKITVSGGALTIDIDNGACLKKRRLADCYSGGYILIGSNYENTLISDIAVMDTENSGGFSFYEAEDIRDGNRRAVKTTKNYTVSGDSFKRKDSSSGITALLSDEIYRSDFETVYKAEFQHGRQTAETVLIIGAINNYDSISSLADSGAKMINIRYTEGEGEKTFAVKSGDSEYGAEKAAAQLLDEPFIFKVTVRNAVLTIDINGEELYSEKLSAKYGGGYISLGTADGGTVFSGIKTESLSDPSNGTASYFSPSLNKNGSLAAAGFDDYWTTEGGLIVRNGNKTASSNTDNMAVLYFDTEKYNNFEMTLRYRSTGERGAYVGFGAEKGRSWWADKKSPDERGWEIDPGNNCVYLLDSGLIQTGPTKSYIEGSNPDTWWYDTWLSQSGKLFTTQEEKAGLHILRLRVENGRLTVWIDDNAQGSTALAKQKSGYIYIAASMAGAAFSAPIITDFDNEPKYDFSNYSAYYAEDAENGMVSVDANDYWRINSSGNLERRPTTHKDPRNLYDIAYLGIGGTKYSSFTLDLEYRHGTTGWRRFFIGFGASEAGKTWRQKNGGIALTVQSEGIVEYNGNINYNGKYGESIFWAITDDDGNKYQQLPDYNSGKWHSLHMEVAAGICTVRIDDYNWDYELVLPTDFNAENLFIAANSSSAEFKNIKIEDISGLYPPDTSPGWQPTDKDVYFDFSQRGGKKRSIYKYEPKNSVKNRKD